MGDACLDEAIWIAGIGLEGAGRIDQHIRGERAQLAIDIAAAIEGRGDPLDRPAMIKVKRDSSASNRARRPPNVP